MLLLSTPCRPRKPSQWVLQYAIALLCKNKNKSVLWYGVFLPSFTPHWSQTKTKKVCKEYPISKSTLYLHPYCVQCGWDNRYGRTDLFGCYSTSSVDTRTAGWSAAGPCIAPLAIQVCVAILHVQRASVIKPQSSGVVARNERCAFLRSALLVPSHYKHQCFPPFPMLSKQHVIKKSL